MTLSALPQYKPCTHSYNNINKLLKHSQQWIQIKKGSFQLSARDHHYCYYHNISRSRHCVCTNGSSLSSSSGLSIWAPSESCRPNNFKNLEQELCDNSVQSRYLHDSYWRGELYNAYAYTFTIHKEGWFYKKHCHQIKVHTPYLFSLPEAHFQHRSLPWTPQYPWLEFYSSRLTAEQA